MLLDDTEGLVTTTAGSNRSCHGSRAHNPALSLKMSRSFPQCGAVAFSGFGGDDGCDHHYYYRTAIRVWLFL